MLKNIKIGSRLAIGFALILLTVGIAMAILWSTLNVVDEEIELLTNDRIPKTVWANDIIDQINIANKALNRAVILKDPEELKKTEAVFKAVIDSINDRYNRLDKSITSEKGRELMKKFSDTRTTYVNKRSEVLELLKAGNNEKAVQYLTNELREFENNYLNSINDLIDYQYLLVDDGICCKNYLHCYNNNYIIVSNNCCLHYSQCN
jgi:methyl-accepting chemotaxis protein